MNTITIKSNKPDDIYFLNELARRLNLETDIKTDEDYQGIGRLKPAATGKKSKETDDKKLADMAFLTSSAALEKFFDNETEKMF